MKSSYNVVEYVEVQAGEGKVMQILYDTEKHFWKLQLTVWLR